MNDSISEEDLERLKVWIQKPKNQEKFKELVRINHELNALNTNGDDEKAFKNVLKQLNGTQGSGAGRFQNFLKYAAVLVGISMIGYILLQNSTEEVYIPQATQIVLELEDGTTQIVQEGQSIIINNASGHKVAEHNEQELVYTSEDGTFSELRYNTLKVPYGKTFGLVLSDGTRVMLNAGSELKYPVQFIENEDNRTVFLDGEAYFEVARNEVHPFIVETQDLEIQVMGTTFNVTSYTEDQKSFAVLVEGKVAAINKLQDQDSEILSPNQKVYFENGQLVKKPVNVEKYVAWVQGQLIFVDDSFKVIKNKLERKYNVTINNTYRALDDINITATFKNETIDQVLKTFQTYMAFDYTNKNGEITITKPK